MFWLCSNKAEALLLHQSASLSAGCDLLANICAAEIHTFRFLTWNISPSFYTDPFVWCSFFGTVICAVLCGLMWNDWAGQVYLSFAVRFTFLPSSLLSVCSLTPFSIFPIIWEITAAVHTLFGDLQGGKLTLAAT